MWGDIRDDQDYTAKSEVGKVLCCKTDEVWSSYEHPFYPVPG